MKQFSRGSIQSGHWCGSAAQGIVWVVWKNARSAFFHTTHTIQRAPQARASNEIGNQAQSLKIRDYSCIVIT